MKNNTNIAIIIAVFNGKATIEQCLTSIQKQSAMPMEVIVIDAASTDGTQEIIKNYSSLVTAFVSEPDKGIYDAWNKGIAKSNSEWVMFLGADDILAREDTLASLNEFCQTQSLSTSIIYSRVEYVKPDGEVVERRGEPWANLQQRMKFEMILPHPGLLHNRNIFETYGMFDASYRIGGDYALLRQVVKASDPVYLPLVTVIAGIGGVSNRPGLILLSIEEVGRAIEAGEGRRPLEWYSMWIKGVIKYYLIRVFGLNFIKKFVEAIKFSKR